jgi:protein subunit release factor A
MRITDIGSGSLHSKNLQRIIGIDIMTWPNSVTKKDLKIDYFSGSGAGGQHRNKRKNCVRMTHIPTKIKSVSQDHKSRAANVRTAFRRLTDKLIPIMKQELLREHIEPNTDRVRTYSQPRNSVKDKRIPNKTYDYSEVLEGSGLGELLGDLQNAKTQDNT